MAYNPMRMNHPKITATGFARAKEKLTSSIDEILVRLESKDDADLFGESIKAAKLAAILGFPCPPIENFVAYRGTPDRVLNLDSNYEHACGIQTSDPDSLAYHRWHRSVYRRVGAETKPLTVETLSLGSEDDRRGQTINMLKRWRRAVGRLQIEDVKYSMTSLKAPVQSGERTVFNSVLKAVLGVPGPNAVPSVSEIEQTADAMNATFDFIQRQHTTEYESVPVVAEDAKAEQVDPVENDSHRSRRVRTMSRDEANQRARELLDNDPSFGRKTARKWASAIGCSVGLVTGLPVWHGIMEKDGRGRRKKGVQKKPRVVSLTPAVEARAGVTDDHSESVDSNEILRHLIEQVSPDERARIHRLSPDEQLELAKAYQSQRVDKEPSPLEDDLPDSRPRIVKTRKSL